MVGAFWRLIFPPLVGDYGVFSIATPDIKGQRVSVTIFIADDYAGWRGKVREILKNHPEWQIVGEASDGLDAVARADQLRPDIAIMDIGLPRLNGITAAMLIRQKSPQTAIVFLSGYSDDYFRQAALDAGAAYVVKAQAVTDLPDAITAALSRDTQIWRRRY
jgi:DNA-binding NarL/FixJ family response regulator